MLEDDIRPVYTAVVRLKSYGKGEDVHVCKNKRPHLMVLTPDTLQLFTTADAGPAYSDDSMSQAAMGAWPSLGFVPRSKPSATSGDSLGGTPSATSLGPQSVLSGDDPEDLNEGQVFRLGVALSQILAVQNIKGNRVRVLYQPNRPSKKGSVEEQTMMVLRTLLSAMDVMSARKDPATPPPTATFQHGHHFTIVAADAMEAMDIMEEIEQAQRKLAMAVLWLSEGLPLRDDSRPVMVTVGAGRGLIPASTAASVAETGYCTGEEGDGSEQLPLATGVNAFTIPFPRWGQEIELPPEVGIALASPGSRKLVSLVISVYLSTPLGSAVAEIPLLSVMHSAMEGGAPITTIARLQDPEAASESLRPGKRWVMSLQWRGMRGPALESTRVQPPASTAGEDFTPSGPNGRSRSPSTSRRELARRPAAPYKAAGGMGVLVGLAALSGFAALARNVRMQLARLGPGAAIQGKESGPAVQCFQWHLALLELTIEEESDRMPAASPPVKRALSISSHHGDVSPPGESLPPHFCLLLQQHPSVLTTDIARRFIIGLGSETKAFGALSSMARWTTENGLWDLLHRPQPAFASMKRHYPHGFPGWSSKYDCLVEVECMGRWPESYNRIAAEGVSEQDMLEHLLFTYQYAFNKLDPRKLPQGKTVKIVDLEGLSMGDLRTPGFKLITRVGAMLSLNFPQRLHRCFLVNAPGWWTVAWRVISPIVPPKIRAQMTLFGKNVSIHCGNILYWWCIP